MDYKEYYQKNKEKFRAWSKEYRSDPVVKAECARRNKGYRDAVRLEVFQHYGMFCCWCGEDHYESLVIDHVNNDGHLNIYPATGKRLGGWNLYKWLKKNNFPDGYQVLCASCNQAKMLNGGVLPPERRNITIHIGKPMHMTKGLVELAGV